MITAIFVGAGCQVPAGPILNSTPTSGQAQIVPSDNRIPGEWLVTVTPGMTLEDMTVRYRPLGVIEVRRVTEHLYLLKFPSERIPTPAEVRAAGAPHVQSVEPNFRYRALDLR